MLISLATQTNTKESTLFVDPNEVICITRKTDDLVVLVFKNGTTITSPKHMNVSVMADAINAARKPTQ